LRQQEVAAATLRDGDRVHILAPIVGGGALLER
jgi:sulfur carrier protein ThiS